MIIEGLRHLDTAIVVALSHARADSTSRGAATHWTKIVRSGSISLLYHWLCLLCFFVVLII